MATSHNGSGSHGEKDGNTVPTSSHSNGSSDNEQMGSSAPAQRKKRKLPPFFDHFNARDLKILFRCSVAFWVASLFIFINPVLDQFGQATFFAGIAVLFLPPSGVVLVFLLGGFTEILGMGLGWAWGVITSKAALATRPNSDLLAQEQRLSQVAQATGTPVTNLVFNGLVLDTRVTITFFCMLGLFIYLMARLRQKLPKFAFTAIFAWIIADVWLTDGPLLPTFNGTLPKVLIEPAAASLAVSLACSLLIFPESTSHLTLYGVHKLVQAIGSSMALTAASLSQYPLNNLESLQGLKAGLIGGWAALEPAFNFLPLDFSVGYWNAQDIAAIKQPLRVMLLHAFSLIDLQINQHRARDKLNRASPPEQDAESSSKPHQHGKHQMIQSLNLLSSLKQGGVEESLVESYRALSSTSDPLIRACQQAIEALLDSIHQNNSRRWFGRLKPEQFQEMRQRHEAALHHLKEERARYPVTANKALLDIHDHLFDATGSFIQTEASRPKLSGLFLGFNFEDRLVRFAETLERPLAHVCLLESERTKIRIWFPTGLRSFFSWAFGKTSTPVLNLPKSDSFPEVDKDALKEMTEKLRGTSKPVRKRGRFSTTVLGFAHWISNDDGVYALRVLVASMSVAVVAVTTQTAGFFYREKGLWALIMAQTGLLPHFSDFTFAFVMRVIGTVAGGIVGMLGWYIGSGNGPGNPYGLAAVMAVLSVVVMWCRLYAPPQHLPTAIIFGATVMLVIGYSWIDTHVPTYGNPGYGYTVFWRRTVLVLVGFGAGFIVSLFPWPTSTSRFVAKTLAQVVHAEADHYALLLSEWRNLEDEKRLLPAIGGTAIHLAETLASLRGPISNLNWEFSSSEFDQETCTKISELVGLMNQFIASLHITASLLPVHLRTRLARVNGLLDHRSVGDVMVVLAVIEQSLKTGDPLPSRLPTPLVNGCIEYGQGSRLETLNKDLLRDEAYRGYTVAISCYLGFLSAADELVLVLKQALGESHYVPEDLANLE